MNSSLGPLKMRAERKDNLVQNQIEYAQALSEGSAEAASRVIETRRCSLGEIYSQVITPSLTSIGDLWCNTNALGVWPEVLMADDRESGHVLGRNQ